ncbi:MAG: DUF503 domain-containing protein [Chloroflexota bacterium]
MSHTIKIGLVTIELHLEGVSSLKEKRGRIKSLTTRLQKQFNVSVAEVGYHDVWQSSAIAVATVTNSSALADQMIANVLKWIEHNYPDAEIVDEVIEIL